MENYLISYIDKKTNRPVSKLVKETTLEDALDQIAKKGQIFEVQLATAKGEPLVDVEWRHLYHF